MLTPRKGRALVAFAALLWSTGGLAIKLVPLSGLGVVFWRSAVTFLFMLVVFRPSAARWRGVSWVTVLLYAGMILSFVTATKMTTAANAIFLQYTGPLYVLALAPVLLDEPFRREDGVAVGVALIGMSLFFVGRLEAGALAGNLMGALSGVFFGGVVLALRREAKGDAIPSVIAGNGLAALLALPFAWGHLALDGPGLLDALFLGIVQMGVSYWIFVRALAVVPAAEASLIGMLEPMLNPVWTWLGVGERPSPWAILGGAIVIASVAGRTIFAARQRH